MAVLKGNKNFYDYEVSDFLAWNLKRWLDYGLLETGAYTNVAFNLPTSGYTNLQKVKDDRHTGSVYEALGPNFIWENDVNPIGRADLPINVSGVYVNNIFYTPSSSGNYPYYIDYRTGRIVFANSLPENTSVKCEYSFSYVATYLVDDPEWRTIEQNYLERYDDLESLSPSGMAQRLKQNRVWLPAVVIDVGDRTNEPLQLGGGEINAFNVDYHLFCDKSFTNRRLCDLISNQYQTTISLFNINDLDFPYNKNGSLNPNALTYPIASSRENQYFWDFAYIEATDGGPRPSDSDVARGEISMTINVDRHLITY